MWNILATAEATFDMFTLAASVGARNVTAAINGLEFGVSASAAVTDTVTIKLGGRWDDHDTTTANTETWRIAGQVVAAVTETVTLTGEIGVDGETSTNTSVGYGSATVAWAPGGGFDTSTTFWGNANGAYKATFKASKSFE